MKEEALIREDPRGWHPSRHPDNAPGQDPCPSRKTGQTIGPGQSLFSLTAFSGFSLFSDQRILGTRSRTGSLNRSASGQALRDDSVRRLCDSIVGANGCSPVSGF